METVSLKISYIDGDSTGSLTVTYIEPSATYAQLDHFARALINMTNNTYVDSTRIVTTSVNENVVVGG